MGAREDVKLTEFYRILSSWNPTNPCKPFKFSPVIRDVGSNSTRV